MERVCVDHVCVCVCTVYVCVHRVCVHRACVVEAFRQPPCAHQCLTATFEFLVHPASSVYSNHVAARISEAVEAVE